jgi:hypothetical protein
MLDDAWRAVAELAASQHRAFTRAQAAANGIDSRRLRTALSKGMITTYAANVFMLGGPPTTLLEKASAASLMSGGTVVSHQTIGSLFRFDGLVTSPIDVSVTGGKSLRIPEGLEVVVHRVEELPEGDIVLFDGIRCTSKARTLVDLGMTLSDEAVLKAVIGAYGAGVTLQVLEATAKRLHRPGRSGTARLLRVVDQLRHAGVVPESWLEEVLRLIIDDPLLPALKSQHELKDDGGQVIARFDHAIPDARLAIEGHSRRFHFGPIQEAIDEDRDLRVARHGWEVLYLGWYAQRRPREVVEAIRDVVGHRVARAAA